jgi:hypothetical protein
VGGKDEAMNTFFNVVRGAAALPAMLVALVLAHEWDGSEQLADDPLATPLDGWPAGT